MSKTLPPLAVVLAVGLALAFAADDSSQPTLQLKASPRRSTWLFVETHPSGASVELDGRLLGLSDGLFRVTPGSHTLTVALDGYEPQHQSVEIDESRIARYALEFERLPAAAPLGAPMTGMDVAPLVVVGPRRRYSVLNDPWGSVPPSGEPQAAAVLEGHEGQVNCVVFSPDGRVLASAGADSTVRLWAVPSGRPRHVLVVQGSRLGVYSVDFSPDGRVLASCSGNVVRLWDAETGRLLSARGDLGPAQSVAFSTDGRTLIVATAADSLTLCDTNSLEVLSVRGISPPPAEVTALGHDDSVRRITYSQDGGLLACAGGWHPQAPGRVTIWDTTTSTARLVSSFSVPGGRVRGVAFSPDARLLAYAAGNTVKLVAMANLPRPAATR